MHPHRAVHVLDVNLFPRHLDHRYVYDRTADPSPHTSIIPPSSALATLRQIANHRLLRFHGLNLCNLCNLWLANPFKSDSSGQGIMGASPPASPYQQTNSSTVTYWGQPTLTAPSRRCPEPFDKLRINSVEGPPVQPALSLSKGYC